MQSSETRPRPLTMEILQLTATKFTKAMSTGRTRPLLLGCEDARGGTFEVVVKLRGPEMTARTQLAELIASQLADDLGLTVPQAAVVNVPPGFETVISDPELARLVRGSHGLNFGSVHLGTGFTTWPPDRNPMGVQRDQAADIFAFDALIQNPDRRTANPNVWARSDRLGVYDHEQAFSFLAVPILGGAPAPWTAAQHSQAFRFLEQHVFYRSLRGGRLNFGPFEERLRALTEKHLRAYVHAAPGEWLGGSDFPDRISSYLCEARHHREAMVSFLKYILR